MRIISQNGEYDIPYERVMLKRTRTSVKVYGAIDSKELEIARYSSEEKAIKAMTMCRYNSESTYFQFPRDEVML